MSFSGTKGYLTKPKPGVMLNPLHPLSRGLVGYWLFNEGSGSRVNDISKYGNHGTLKNMSPNAQNSGWGSSEFGGGLHFDNTDDYVSIPDTDTLSFTSGGMSIIAWVNRITDGSIVDKYDTDKYEYSLSLYNNAYIYIVMHDEGVPYIGRRAPIFSSNESHLLVATYDGGTTPSACKIFVDCVQVDDTNFNHGEFVSMKNLGQPVSFGRSNPMGDSLDASIDYVCLYNRVFSITEQKQLYHDPFCNLLQVPIRRYPVAAPPVGAIMNQFQRANIGADLYNGVFA